MSLLLFLEVVYLRSSVLAGRCLPAVLTSTCGAFGMFTSGGAEIVMPDGIWCIPPVVSPTLGGSKFVYTSGGSCGRACIIPPKILGHLPPVGQRYLCLTAWGCIPPVVSPTLGGSKFEYTSGGSCGRACNTRPGIGTSTCGATDIYLRC